MNFGIIFCALGIFLWMVQVIYKITECASVREKLPDWNDYKECVGDERTMRNIRAVRIGAYFFFVFGIFGWSITAGKLGSYLNDWQMFYALDRLLLLLSLYLNVSMRLLIYRLSGGGAKLTGLAEIITSFRMTAFFPHGEDIPSLLVRGTNTLFLFALALFIFLIYKGV